MEAGLLLLVVPWSTFWDRNFFATAVPGLEAAIQNNFVRGAVSGLGLITLWAGLVELSFVMAGWRRPETGDAGTGR